MIVWRDFQAPSKALQNFLQKNQPGDAHALSEFGESLRMLYQIQDRLKSLAQRVEDTARNLDQVCCHSLLIPKGIMCLEDRPAKIVYQSRIA